MEDEKKTDAEVASEAVKSVEDAPVEEKVETPVETKEEEKEEEEKEEKEEGDTVV